MPRKDSPARGLPGAETPPGWLEALACLASGDAEGAVAVLRRSDDPGAEDLAARIVLLARHCRAQHPRLALELAGLALAADNDCAEACLLAGLLHGVLGEAGPAQTSLIKLLGAANASPRQKLLAATLLDAPDWQAAALAAGERAFAAMGRPLAWAAPLLDIALRTAAWSLAEALQAQLAAAYARDAFDEAGEVPRTHFDWCGDEMVNLRLVAAWAARSLPKPLLSRQPRLPLAGRRLRVGYLSSDFREHPSGRLLNGLFRAHDRSAVELFMYCSGWDDGSALRRELEAHFSHVHRVAQLSDAAAAELIRSHGIDVLVDLNGPTRAHRMGILVRRPAPVQIHYLGWPGSTGGRGIDYLIADDYVIPLGREQDYPERLIRLVPTYQVNGYGQRAPAPLRSDFGLPEYGPVLGAFNQIRKVGATVWVTWMRILSAVPEATLWLLDPGPLARRHIAGFTAGRGIDPKRIVVAPPTGQVAHLARLQCCDLMLDPWPYGGHTTTSDALHAGVPVIALEGTNFASRVSGSLLRAAGLSALVRPDRDAYVRTAVDLLRHPEKLARVRRFIAEEVAGSPLFDMASRARQLEYAYRFACERAISGLPPTNINFTPATP